MERYGVFRAEVHTHRSGWEAMMKTKLFISVLLLAAFAYAEKIGTRATFRKDALPYLADAPELQAILTNVLDVAEEGEGLLIPSGTGLQPDRISPPFTFEAKPNGQAGHYTLIVRIPMRFEDANGHLPPHRIEIITKETKITEPEAGGYRR